MVESGSYGRGLFYLIVYCTILYLLNGNGLSLSIVQVEQPTTYHIQGVPPHIPQVIYPFLFSPLMAPSSTIVPRVKCSIDKSLRLGGYRWYCDRLRPYYGKCSSVVVRTRRVQQEEDRGVIGRVEGGRVWPFGICQGIRVSSYLATQPPTEK